MFKVVDNCNVVIGTPPTGDLTSLNLTKSFTSRSPFGEEIFKTVFEVVVKGWSGKKSCVAGSTLAGLALGKPCGSPPCGLGSNWGCLGSNSEICTLDPFHSVTISL